MEYDPFTERMLDSFGDSALTHGECCVCLEQKPLEIAVLEGRNNKRVCRHFVCSSCAAHLQPKKCPVCRQVFTTAEKLPAPNENPEKTFALLDSNGDGKLQVEEVVDYISVMTGLTRNAVESQLAVTWQKWDANNDRHVDFRYRRDTVKLLSINSDTNTSLAMQIRSA